MARGSSDRHPLWSFSRRGLGIENDDDSRQVPRSSAVVAATQDESPAASHDDEMRMAMASLYSGITWWQESLLRAVTAPGPAN